MFRLGVYQRLKGNPEIMAPEMNYAKENSVYSSDVERPEMKINCGCGLCYDHYIEPIRAA